MHRLFYSCLRFHRFFCASFGFYNLGSATLLRSLHVEFTMFVLGSALFGLLLSLHSMAYLDLPMPCSGCNASRFIFTFTGIDLNRIPFVTFRSFMRWIPVCIARDDTALFEALLSTRSFGRFGSALLILGSSSVGFSLLIHAFLECLVPVAGLSWVGFAFALLVIDSFKIGSSFLPRSFAHIDLMLLVGDFAALEFSLFHAALLTWVCRPHSASWSVQDCCYQA